MTSELRSLWPLLDLRVVTPRLSLRGIDDEAAAALAMLASRGVHDPDSMPFLVPWTDAESPYLERGSLQFVWRMRAEWAPDSWVLPLAVEVDGELVGMQSVKAEDFAILREVETGSWLGLPHQGMGIGTEMRHAVLHLAFAGLGAEHARSGGFHDNHASLAVSAKLGYEVEGRRRVVRREQADWLMGLRLTRERWQQIRREDIRIEGLEPCRSMFGL